MDYDTRVAALPVFYPFSRRHTPSHQLNADELTLTAGQKSDVDHELNADELTQICNVFHGGTRRVEADFFIIIFLSHSDLCYFYYIIYLQTGMSSRN